MAGFVPRSLFNRKPSATLYGRPAPFPPGYDSFSPVLERDVPFLPSPGEICFARPHDPPSRRAEPPCPPISLPPFLYCGRSASLRRVPLGSPSLCRPVQPAFSPCRESPKIRRTRTSASLPSLLPDWIGPAVELLELLGPLFPAFSSREPMRIFTF